MFSRTQIRDRQRHSQFLVAYIVSTTTGTFMAATDCHLSSSIVEHSNWFSSMFVLAAFKSTFIQTTAVKLGGGHVCKQPSSGWCDGHKQSAQAGLHD